MNGEQGNDQSVRRAYEIGKTYIIQKWYYLYLLQKYVEHKKQKFNENILLDGCIPYSQQTCEDLIDRIGALKGGGGYDFVGDYGTKGCYSYHKG